MLKKVANDGSGSLFLGSDLTENRIVLIKKTIAGNEQYPFFQECFQNQIEITNFLEHENILSFIDYGWYDGSFYTVMNHVDGCDLSALISHPQFDDSIGLMILTLALETLHYCHVKGISHGDLRPAHFLITRSGQVHLTGFGVSRMITAENQYSFFSTPLLLSPELVQIVDEQNHIENNQFENTTLLRCRNDSWSNGVQLLNTGNISQDIWSVGVLLFRICTGSYPFYSDNLPTLFSSIIQNNPMNHQKFRTEIPKSIVSIIGQCLLKNPNHRLNSLDPVLNVLHEHFHSHGISFFNEYIAHYLNQKSDLITFAVTTETTPVINLPSVDHTAKEQLHNKPYGYETKVLRHLVAPDYSLPQVNTTPTVKLDPKLIRQAFESPNKSKNIVQKLRTLSRVYRVHITLASAILAFVTLLIVSGSFFIERFGNKSSKQAVVQHTEKKNRPRKPLHKKETVPTATLPEKSQAQELNPPDRSDSIPVHHAPVSQTVSVVANHSVTSSSLSKTKVSQPVQQPLSKKSTQPTTSTASSGITKRRLPEPAVIYSNQIENSVEQTGRLKISIDPPHARVLIDETVVDNNEIASGKDLTIGNHTITADALEYESYSATVSIEKGQSTVLSVALKVIAKGNGQVHIFSYPWANLFVDGELKGTTPTAVPILLGEGTHDISLQRDGYETYTDQVTVKTGDVLRLKVDMKKID